MALDNSEVLDDKIGTKVVGCSLGVIIFFPSSSLATSSEETTHVFFFPVVVYTTLAKKPKDDNTPLRPAETRMIQHDTLK